MMFDDFEKTKFPEESCTISDPDGEKGVFDSPDLYLCVIAGLSWPKQCRLEYLRPYVCFHESSEHALFGWTRTNWSGWISHKDNPVHPFDEERVVAWKKVDAAEDFFEPWLAS